MSRTIFAKIVLSSRAMLCWSSTSMVCRAADKPWSWRDGESVAFVNWLYGDPHHEADFRCAAMLTTTGEWCDEGCDRKFGYVCKVAKREYRRSAMFIYIFILTL